MILISLISIIRVFVIIGSEDDQSNTISLSMDDLMQYAQPVPDNVITEENGLEDKIAGGSATTKFVTLGMMVS